MIWRDYIGVDPEVLAGKPVIKGTRVSVQLLLDRLADGWTEDEICNAYAGVTLVALQAVFAFASEVMRDEDYVARGIAAA
jgi:uncharacterized protein (DUF433 family)